MDQAFYRKWRPQQWDQVIGQQHVIQTLRNSVLSERVAHAYLFAGPRGTGKTTTARILAKAVNCQDDNLHVRPCDRCDNCIAVNKGRYLDLIEIDAASNTSVDDVRDLRDKINFSPNIGRYKVYIVDEVHMLSTAAFNALLKTLEEPPRHAIFILATTEIHKIPLTVLSRCQRHEFRRIPVAEIVAHLEQVATKEDLQVEKEALYLVARQATGSMRDAISLLDQLASTGETITLAAAQSVLGTVASQSILDLIEAIISGDATQGLEHLHQALDAGSDARQYARQVVDYLRNLLLVRMGNADQIDATPELKERIAFHAQRFEVSELLRLTRLFNQAANDIRNAWHPALPLEIALVEAINAGVNTPGVKSPPGSSIPSVSQPISSPDSSTETTLSQPETSGHSESSDSRTFRTVIDQWRQILNLVRTDNRNTEALLRSGRVLGIKDGVMYFGLSEVLKGKIEKNNHLELIKSTLAAVLQQEVEFRCVVSTGKPGTVPPEVESDGMVAAALRDLGGEIVDVQ